jgi:hypothetical protein
MVGKRVEIARSMEFALNRAEAADEVSAVHLSLGVGCLYHLYVGPQSLGVMSRGFGMGRFWNARGSRLTVQVADVIATSLKLDKTPVPRKLARLHLISDILHNSVGHIPTYPDQAP